MNPVDVPKSPADDRDLARRFALGDTAAFDELLAHHGPSLARLATRLLGWEMQDAHDALQEVFMNAYSHRRSFRLESSVHTWLVRITLNTCRAVRRRRLLHIKLLTNLLRSPSRPPIVILEAPDELAQQVRTAVARLSAREREVVILFYLEELSAADVAAALAISESAVNVRLHRARKNLAPMLTPQGDLRHE